MSETLTVSDLVVEFDAVSVLSGLSFGLQDGTVACVVGPNGSGKTTLLRSIAGLLRPDRGSIEVDADEGRAVGYLPQTPAFRPTFTVRETLAGYAALVDGDVDIDDRLSTVGLEPVADRRVDALSGGMVRLLGLAQATIGDPALFVLDEPASGLDPQMSRHIASIVTDFATDGAAVILATHDLVAVERIADRLLVLDHGSFVASGSPAEIRDSADADSLDEALDALISRDEAVTVRAGGEADE